MSIMFPVITAVTILLSFCSNANGIQPSPILIFPGLRGSQLEAKISDGSNCDTKGKWEVIWINIKILPRCINKVLSLQYDATTNTYSNEPGVQVRVPGFGKTNTVEYLSESYEVIPYFHAMVNHFVTTKGYVRNQTIRAVPYDWRLAPDTLENSGYYTDIKLLIEIMFKQAGNRKVTIVAHSMGGPVSLYFLNRVVDQAWKDTYINAYVPLSGAWSGGNRGLAAFVSNLTLSSNWYAALLRDSFPTMESAVWLLPSPRVWGNKVLITTSQRTYSANQYEQMFMDIHRPEDYARFTRTLSINGNWPAPNVPVHCFYGVMPESTPEVFHYGALFPLRISYKNATLGTGDTVVNLDDSKICLQWESQAASFTHQTFSFTHMEMVNSPDIFQAIDLVVG